MNELEAFNSERIYWAVEQVERVTGDIDTRHLDDSQFYLKSEADKVIAELEENHKKEVEQLLIEIAELESQKAQAEDDCAYWKMNEGNAVNEMHETEEYAMQLYKEARHSNYKRCLAMAKICENKLGTVVKPGWWDKWHKRWLKLAKNLT